MSFQNRRVKEASYERVHAVIHGVIHTDASYMAISLSYEILQQAKPI